MTGRDENHIWCRAVVGIKEGSLREVVGEEGAGRSEVGGMQVRGALLGAQQVHGGCFGRFGA